MSRATLEHHQAKHHLAHVAKMLDAAMNKVSHAG
jgi:hypothetical protein